MAQNQIESSRLADEESIVSSIQADEIEEVVEFPEIDIELSQIIKQVKREILSQESIEEGSNSNNSFRSIVV